MDILKNRPYIPLLLTALCLSVFMLTSFSQNDHSVEEDQPATRYDWSNLTYEMTRPYYYENGVLASRIGVDVSDHQKIIDWKAVAEDGIDFAIIRAGYRGYTEGKMYPDAQYETNMQGARDAGLDVGVYFFSQAISEEEAREEANFVIENLRGYTIAYPIVYDFEPVEDAEGRANSLSKEQLTANAQAFCKEVEKAGYQAMLYGNRQDLTNYNLEDLKKYPLWFAEYEVMIPTAQLDFSLWQYTHSGFVEGISTKVDINIHFLVGEKNEES